MSFQLFLGLGIIFTYWGRRCLLCITVNYHFSRKEKETFVSWKEKHSSLSPLCYTFSTLKCILLLISDFLFTPFYISHITNYLCSHYHFLAKVTHVSRILWILAAVTRAPATLSKVYGSCVVLTTVLHISSRNLCDYWTANLLGLLHDCISPKKVSWVYGEREKINKYSHDSKS